MSIAINRIFLAQLPFSIRWASRRKATVSTVQRVGPAAHQVNLWLTQLSMVNLWPWPIWQNVVPPAQARGSSKEEERQSQAQTWQSISLAQIIQASALDDESLGHCQIPRLFLATDSFFCCSKKLFNSPSSILKLLPLITTPLLLCFPTALTGNHIPFPSTDVSYVDPSWFCVSLVSKIIFSIPGSFICSSLEWFYITFQMTFLLQYFHGPAKFAKGGVLQIILLLWRLSPVESQNMWLCLNTFVFTVCPLLWFCFTVWYWCSKWYLSVRYQQHDLIQVQHVGLSPSEKWRWYFNITLPDLPGESSRYNTKLVIVLIQDSSLRRFSLYFQNHLWSGQLVQILLKDLVSEASKVSEVSESWENRYLLCAVREQVMAKWAGWLGYLSSKFFSASSFLGHQLWGWQLRENNGAVNTLQRLRVSVFIGLILTLSHTRTITEIIRFK